MRHHVGCDNKGMTVPMFQGLESPKWQSAGSTQALEGMTALVCQKPEVPGGHDTVLVSAPGTQLFQCVKAQDPKEAGCQFSLNRRGQGTPARNRKMECFAVLRPRE